MVFRIKFNNYMVKCLDCKIITHLECKDFIPAVCIPDQLKINALNVSILLFLFFFFIDINYF